MDGIKEYLFRLICVSIICAMIFQLTQKKSTQATVIRLMCGVFMLLTLISPLKDFDISALTQLELPGFSQAQEVVAMGTAESQNALRKSIKETVEAYILQEANSYDATIAVDVTVAEDDPPYPKSVTITGAVSPYAKTRISEYIESKMGIAREDQQWT